MRVLAVDTSSWWGSAAAVEDADGTPTVVAEVGDVVEGTHARSLVGWIDRVMAEAGWSRSQVDAYVAVRGPGSFTGLRIGLGTVVGLGLAAERPAVGVVGLQAMALAAGPGEGNRIACLDAGRSEVYTAVYDTTGEPPVERRAPSVGSPERQLTGTAGRLIVRPPTPDRLERWSAWAPETTAEPSPAALAGAAGRLALWRGIAADAPAPTPLYLRGADVRPPA